jgi:hypothetical protein
MTHCTMEDLLDLRAGDGSVAARRHVTECAVCGAELEALHQRAAQLRALPPRRPSRDRWPAVRATIAAERRLRQRRLAWRIGGLAAAAGLFGIVVLRGLGPGAAQAYGDEIALAKQESAAIEERLGEYDVSGGVMSGREAALAADLEDRIAVIDGALAQTAREAELLDLWQRRVDLMEQLFEVRVSRTAYVAF